MTKRLCISISDFIYDSYLSNLTKEVNTSKYIEKLIILGSESQIGQDESIKSKLLEAHQNLTSKDAEINKLKLELGKAKTQLKELEEKQKKKGEDKWTELIIP